MAPNLTLQQQQAIAKAKARARASSVEPLGNASGEWDLSKFEALPRQQQAPAPALNAPNPITTAVRQSQVQAGNQWQQNKLAEQARAAEASRSRKESAAAFGGGMDLMPTEDAGGNVKPGGDVDRDVGAFITGSPVHVVNAGKNALQSTLNLPLDALNSIPGGRKIPTLDVPDIPLPKELDSTTAEFAKPLLQFLFARKIVGNVAPGGGSMAMRAKDAAAGAIGFEADAPRLSELANEYIQQSGSPQFAKDFIGWMAERDPNNPLLERFKNAVDFALPEEIVRAGGKVLSAADRALTGTPNLTPTNAGGARPGSVRPAAQPSPAPVSPIPQTGPRAAQGGPPSPGQQPTPGPAPVAPGVTGGQGGGVLPVINATQVSPGVWTPTKHQILVARDTAKITGRLMRSAGVKDADVKGYLTGAVQRYKSLNDSRVPFAFFLERDLPQNFPETVADEVVTKLQGWGRERNASTAPKDASRSITQKTIKTLRGSQQDFITHSAQKNLFKGSLLGQEDQIIKSLKETGKKGYEPALDYARQALDGRRVPTKAEADALVELKQVMANPMLQGYIDDATRIRAAKDGLDIDKLIESDPVGSAHWLQSEFRRLSDASEDAVTGKPTRMSSAYDDLREMILDPLKRSSPGYEGAMNRFGHEFGSKEAVKFGRGAFTKARSAYETGQLVRKFKSLGTRQQTVAWKSIRDEFLNEFRGTPEDAAAKLTRMQQEGALDLLEQLGARGKKFADDIRKIAQQENPSIRAIEQASGPLTHSNQQGGKAARSNVQGPINKAVGALGDQTSWPMTLAADAVVMATTPVKFPVASTAKIVGKIADRFGNPSPQVLSRATEGLYGLPAPNTNALAPPPKPRGIGPKRTGGPPQPAAPQDIGALLKQLDEAETNANTRGGPQGKKLLKQIDAERERLNALSAPPSPPVKGPVNKAGFFGSGSKPLDMSEAGAGIREIGGGGPDITRYAFDAAKGYRVEVGVLGDGSVHFGTAPNHYAAGVGGTQGAGQFTGAEASKILRGVQETIALDAQKTGRARYVLEPQDQRMQSLVQKAKPPAGYTAKQTQWGVEFVLDPSQSGSSKLLAGMGKGTGGRIASQVGPPAFAATVASVGPEGEPYEDKLKRMGVAALAASGARNAGAIMRGVNALKGGAKAAERVPEQSGFFGGKGPPKPANDTLPKGQKTPAEDLAMAREFNKEPLTPERAYDFWALLKDEKDLNKVIDVLDINLNPSILSLPRGRAMVERTREEVLRRVTTYLRKETEVNKASTLSRANAKFEENNRSIANEITQLRERGVPDQMIARSLGLEDGSLEYFLRWSEPTKPPPAQAGFFSGGKGPPKAERPVLGKRTIEELQRASKLLSPEARQAIADNAAKPPSMRVSAAEASGDDPSLYALVAPFQNIKKPLVPNPARTFRNALAPNSRIANKLAGPPIRNPIAEGVQTGLGRIDQRVGSPPPLDSAAETARLAEKQRRAATSEATRTANKLNPYVNEAAGIPDKPLPKSVARREDETTQLAIAARDVLKSSRLSAEDYAAAVKWADKKKQDIADALLTGRAPTAGGPVLTSSSVKIGGAGSPMKTRLGKRVSRAEAQDMAGLLFDRENAKLLDDVLSGRVTPKNRSDHHYALMLAASLGAGGVGIAAMASNLREDGLPFTPKAPVAEPPDPRWKDDPEKTSRDYKRVKEAQVMLNAIFGTGITEDGKMIRVDGKPSRTQELVRRFQWEHQDDYGLEVTGLLDADTLQAMGEVYREALKTTAPRHAQTTMQ